ncbi:hypothetical protein POM88_023256 [Heracleum sosnowskyi]|uniref:Uncharacterized protein n=1 Tax=Heracleum sosnowskyi TaxID=360622 RepID=A0AAD8IHA2_9APIA|nr:hypothetical protein POM88_023256 [Heracleum sosnowskyi]
MEKNNKILRYLKEQQGGEDRISILSDDLIHKIVSSLGFFPITFGISELETVNVKLRGSNEGESIATSKDWKMYYYTQVVHMFPGLSSARILTLDLETIEALSAVSLFLVQFLSPFYQLKHVKVPKGPKESIARGGNNRASSSRAPGNSGLWKGHEVNSECLGLLDCIAERYPETFDYFTTHSKFCTIKLNALCATVKAFTKTSMNEVDTEMIAEYRAQFADLQRSFNVRWLVNRLDYIEKLRFPDPLLDKLHGVDSRIDDAKSKLQDLQALRVRIMTESYRDIGTTDTSLDVGYIGDDLFSAL